MVYLFGLSSGIITSSNLRSSAIGFLGSALISLPILYVGIAIKRSLMRVFTKIPQDRDDIIKHIIHDKDFIIDLSKIIEEEGGIYIFLKKTTPKSRPSLHTDDTHDNLIFSGGYKGKYWIQNVSSKETPAIIDKIIAAPSVALFLEKYRMTEWNNYLGNHIFLFITDPTFQSKYATMLSIAGLDQSLARREMTLEEKKIYWDIDES
ncbi:MAG: hypothetical protein ACKO41_02930 [Sphingomonadales bacterium]